MKIFMPLALLLCISISSISQTSLQGTVTDFESGEPIIFGTVALYLNGVLLTGTETDFDGYFSITEINPGRYDIVFSYTGYEELKISGTEVTEGKSNLLRVKMKPGPSITCYYYSGCGNSRPLIRLDETTQGMIFQHEDLRRLPYRW